MAKKWSPAFGIQMRETCLGDILAQSLVVINTDQGLLFLFDLRVTMTDKPTPV